MLVLVLAIWLPESPRFLAAQGESVARVRPRCCSASTSPRDRAADRSMSREGNPIAMLFGRGLRAADHPAVDHLLLQPAEPVPVRLLDADGAAT